MAVTEFSQFANMGFTSLAYGSVKRPERKPVERKEKAMSKFGTMLTAITAAVLCLVFAATPGFAQGSKIVVDGSTTVFINKLPACRAGDTIVEAIGPPNKIAMGCPTVIIGG